MFIDEGGAAWAAADPTVGDMHLRTLVAADAGCGPGQPLGRMGLIEAIPGAVNGTAPSRRSPRWGAAARAVAAAASLATAPCSWQQ
eukprot:687209-Alexandrium_andersonii.AAC.1